MALHILQPGLRPIGQFDLKTTTGTNDTVLGGEIGVLETTTSDRAAADVANVGPVQPSDSAALCVTLGCPAIETSTTGDGNAAGLRFLLDEGTDEYGTLFGTMIGGAAGQGVRYGVTNSGAVTALGPSTALASGKVTCWHAPGLYGVSGTTVTTNLAALTVNAELQANATTGILDTAGATDTVAVMVGAMFDDSLVSTTLAAAGETAAVSKYAIYFLGQR